MIIRTTLFVSLLAISIYVKAVGPIEEEALPTEKVTTEKRNTDVFAECLKTHYLIADGSLDWLTEKGLIQDMITEYNNNKSEREIEEKIKSNKSFQGLPVMVQIGTMINLGKALEECIEKASK